MRVPSYKNIIFCCLIGFFCSINGILYAQPSSGLPAPSETRLAAIVQDLQTKSKHQRLKIVGMVSGFFTQKDQLDYVFWLNEQEHLNEQQRQLVKLIWQENEWTVATIAWLPAGTTMGKSNFVDVTGDDILDVLYSYSYSNPNCVDGCAILSLKDSVAQELYSKKEERPCQRVKWSLYQNDAELPFINYKLVYQKKSLQKSAQLIAYRYVKKYQGGTNDKDVLEKARIDSSFTSLDYDVFSNTFFEPLDVACDDLAVENDLLNPRHPALRLALHYLNRNGIKKFDIERAYRANVTAAGQQDYLFLSSIFNNPRDAVQKRKLVKISCDGTSWSVKGLVYVSANFTNKSIQDVDGDGIDELIDEQAKSIDNKCIITYRILSFRGTIGQSIYSHKNNYTTCDSLTPLDRNKVGTVLGETYSIEFKDIDEDGLNEILQHTSTGTIHYKYNPEKQRFLPLD